ncbi:hypothetical protein, partial [Alistipes putredinis]|uniref:hypothetical protein n=1 Tax=Alistipes putredinis TaxID=28117 RepID=UPI00307E0295
LNKLLIRILLHLQVEFSKYYLSYIGASTGYRIIMFQDLLFRYIRPGDGKNAACGLKIIFFGGDFL